MLKENHCKMFCNPENAVDSRRLCEFLHECFELRSKNRVQSCMFLNTLINFPLFIQYIILVTKLVNIFHIWFVHFMYVLTVCNMVVCQHVWRINKIIVNGGNSGWHKSKRKLLVQCIDPIFFKYCLIYVWIIFNKIINLLIIRSTFVTRRWPQLKR